jgi:hypothetical protein
MANPKEKNPNKKTMADLAKETKRAVKEDPKAKTRNTKRDVTGQTHTTLKQMKSRLKEVPKKSAATKHDKAAYEEE